MLSVKYKEEINRANDVIGLRKKYSLPLSDENIKNMQMNDWNSFVKSVIHKEAFMELQIECSYDEKTGHILHKIFKLVITSYLKRKLACLTSRLTSKTSMPMF